MKNILFLPFLLIVSFCFACENSIPNNSNKQILIKNSWKLNYIQGFKTNKKDYQKFHISFSNDKISIKAFNNLNATVTISNNQISVTNISSTRMLPANPKLEKSFIQKISDAKIYYIKGNLLYLGVKDNQLIFSK